MRVRSLRVRTFVVVAAVVLAPLAAVWLGHVADAGTGRRMLVDVERAAAEVADGADPAEVAAEHGVWVRRVGPDGALVADHDRYTAAWLTRLGDLVFEPDGAPTLDAWDAGQAPLAERTSVAHARTIGVDSDCVTDAKLQVCHAALLTRDGGVVHAQAATRRPIRALHDVRYQLARLMLVDLFVGLVLAGWLGWRMVTPLESLQAQVLARRGGRLAPVELDRDDEFGDLARAFNTLLADLAAREKANEAFAADLVHEVRNPVAAVRAAAEALEADRPLDPERARRLARVLRDSSGRLDALAGRFLELARAEAGLEGQARERVDLAAMAAALVEAAAARHEGVSVAFEGAGSACVVGVPERLETAVRNLLENAVHFAREGGGHVVVRVTAGEEVAVAVQDDGPGVSAEDLPRVFERFFTRRARGGTGLGLALARAIAEAHGGRAWAESGPGATFGITVPAAP